ncbi:hypothetical protein [Notoacmeibacter ruber]|uniref:Uncharacterized protein n=1 Tax=Notoacmeibacter ruber TaxID=2670375 RepID=A0A3L7JEJ0_9HYPH|nr:hypothetical protein [Notoacmeibacter ruber]RLQ88890.1 hypothetical protein D8780_12305 [Notoacmeibacter ruber]
MDQTIHELRDRLSRFRQRFDDHRGNQVSINPDGMEFLLDELTGMIGLADHALSAAEPSDFPESVFGTLKARGSNVVEFRPGGVRS